MSEHVTSAINDELITQWVQRDRTYYFGLAMVMYAASVLFSLWQPQVVNRTNSQLEAYVLFFFNIILVAIGLAAWWYSRQTERIHTQLVSLPQQEVGRGQAAISIAGAGFLAFISAGAPVFLLVAFLVAFYGVMQWRWAGYRDQLETKPPVTSEVAD